MKKATLLALAFVLFFVDFASAQAPAARPDRLPDRLQDRLQDRPKIVLTAIVQDSITGKALPFADAVLYSGADSAVAAASVPENGKVTLRAPKPGVYKLYIGFVGYGTYVRTLRLTQDLDLGPISLGRKPQLLAEVQIQGQAAPVRQRRDTTEFNAGSFKVTQDASSEDLVSKMPGITTDGSTIKAMGETINQVTVDGKPFFGDDPAQTLRNMPAEMVDKVQLFDQRSETSRLTGFDDGQRTKTMNIVTKANRRKGSFGRGTGFVGNPDKYAGSIVVNKFSGNRRLTLLSQANNINQQNFQMQDLVGAMGGGRGMGGGQTRTSTVGGGGGGGFSPGGQGGGFGGLGSFFVGQQGGINSTAAAGTNYSDSWGKHLEMSSSYFFNRTHNASDQAVNRSYITNGLISQRFTEQAQDRGTNINNRASARFEYKPDTMNTVVLRPRYSSQNNATTSSTLDTTTREGARLSTLANNNRSTQYGQNASTELLWRHRFQKMGRSLVINLNGSVNTQNSLTARNTASGSLQSGVLVPDSSKQKIQTNSRNQTAGTNITYTEGLGKHLMALVTYQPDYQYRASVRATRTVNVNGNLSDEPSLSSDIASTYLTQQAGTGLRYNKGTLNVGGQINYQRSDLKASQIYLGQTLITTRSFNAILPQFNLNYRPTKDQNLNFNANTSTQAPSASQLQTVVNTSNLLSLSTGNPNLRQNYRLDANGNYSKTMPEAGRLFSVFAGGGLVGSYIGNSTLLSRKDSVVDGGVQLPAGGQLTRPENLGNQYNMRAFTSYATPLKAVKSTLNLTSGYNTTSTPGKINGALNRSASHGISAGVSISSNISENLDFTVGTTSTYTLVRNKLQSSANYNFLNQNSRFTVKYIFWRGISVTSTITHTFYNGLAAGFNQNILYWNATLGKKLGKTQQWEVQLQAFDILAQNNSVSRSISDIYVQDTRTNVLQRFFMVGLTYTLRKFNGQGMGPSSLPALPAGADPGRIRRIMQSAPGGPAGSG